MAFQYLGLRAKLEHVDVTEEEVNRQLVRLQQQSQRRTPVFDRPSQNGDELVLDAEPPPLSGEAHTVALHPRLDR